MQPRVDRRPEDQYTAGVYPSDQSPMAAGSVSGTTGTGSTLTASVATGGKPGPLPSDVVQAIRTRAGLCSPAQRSSTTTSALLLDAWPSDASGLDHAFLCNSGTEAIEAAIKFARSPLGGPGSYYHARLPRAPLGSRASLGKNYREPFQPLIPDIKHVPYDNLEAMAGAIDDSTAAVVVEVVQGGVASARQPIFHGLRPLHGARGAAGGGRGTDRVRSHRPHLRL